MIRKAIFFILIILLKISPVWGALKVGIILPLSGSQGREGLVLQHWSQELARYFQKQDNIELQLFFLDSHGDPSSIPSLVEQALLEGIKVLIGPARPECAQPLAKEASKINLLTIIISGEVNPIKEWRKPLGSIFRVGLSSREAVKALYYALRKKGYHYIGLLISTDYWGKIGEKWLNAYAAEFGLHIKKTRHFSPSDTDVTSHLEALLDTEAVVCWAGPWSSLMVARNIEQMGFKLPIYFSHHISAEGFLLNYPALQGKPFVGAAFLAPRKYFPGPLSLYNLLQEFCLKEQITYHLSLTALTDAFLLLTEGIKKGNMYTLIYQLETLGMLKGLTGCYFLSPDNHYGILAPSVGLFTFEEKRYKMISRPQDRVL